MDPTLAVSMLLATHKAEASMAAASRMRDISPKATAQLMESVSDSADTLERIAAQVATGTGEMLDRFV